MESVAQTKNFTALPPSCPTGHSAQQSAEAAIAYMGQRVHGCGGVIVVGPQGDLGQHFSSERMPWAMLRNRELRYGIEPGEDNAEIYAT